MVAYLAGCFPGCRKEGEGKMELNLRELQEIERLLSNRMNACPDPDVERLRHKIREEINDVRRQINHMVME